MSAIRRISNGFRSLIAFTTSHWRQVTGALFVVGLLGGIQLARLDYPTAGSITIVFLGSAAFLAMFDFEGMRKGVIWTAALALFAMLTQLAFANNNKLFAVLGVLCVGAMWIHLAHTFKRWSEVYKRQYAQPGEITILSVREEIVHIS